MGREYFSYNPGTNTVQAPLPTKFEHVLKFVTKVEEFKTLHSHEDIINVNRVLEETLNLQISNIIQRVIAQIIGQTSAGFVTIKGTDDGALHVYIAGSEEASPVHVAIEAGTELIGKVQIEGTSQEVRRAKIDSAAGGDILTISPTGSNKIKVVNVVLTVGGETNIRYYDGGTEMTGPMDFGGANEPRGMVAHHGNFPLCTSGGSAFKINSSEAVQVSGYVIYFEE